MLKRYKDVYDSPYKLLSALNLHLLQCNFEFFNFRDRLGCITIFPMDPK